MAAQQNHTVNGRFKDTLFRKIFKEKEALLSLYNAVNHSDYANPDDIIVNTLEDVIYIGMKNDVSFLFSGVMNLYEHQSTVNPNMPLRGLFYFSKIYQNHMKDDSRFLYGRKHISLPFPQYVVFYNGIEKEAEYQELRLSDAFVRPVKTDEENSGLQDPYTQTPALECVVKVLNINAGHNRELMERCRILADYAEFVGLVREHLAEEMEIEEAVDRAVEICIRKGILKEFLGKNRMEVKEMILAEYDREKHIECVREEEWNLGLKEGQRIGFEKGQKTGQQEGTERMSHLISSLIEADRQNELARAASDESYRELLFKEFGI